MVPAVSATALVMTVIFAACVVAVLAGWAAVVAVRWFWFAVAVADAPARRRRARAADVHAHGDVPQVPGAGSEPTEVAGDPHVTAWRTDGGALIAFVPVVERPKFPEPIAAADVLHHLQLEQAELRRCGLIEGAVPKRGGA